MPSLFSDNVKTTWDKWWRCWSWEDDTDKNSMMKKAPSSSHKEEMRHQVEENRVLLPLTEKASARGGPSMSHQQRLQTQTEEMQKEDLKWFFRPWKRRKVVGRPEWPQQKCDNMRSPPPPKSSSTSSERVHQTCSRTKIDPTNWCQKLEAGVDTAAAARQTLSSSVKSSARSTKLTSVLLLLVILITQQPLIKAYSFSPAGKNEMEFKEGHFLLSLSTKNLPCTAMQERIGSQMHYVGHSMVKLSLPHRFHSGELYMVIMTALKNLYYLWLLSIYAKTLHAVEIFYSVSVICIIFWLVLVGNAPQQSLTLDLKDFE